MSYQKPEGTNGILPGTSEKQQFVEETVRLIFKDYRYQGIRAPIFEHYKVISHSAGDATDIVSKKMYDLYGKGDRHVTLRPKGTAPIVRAFVEDKLYGPKYTKPYKTYYVGPVFRYERPQADRLRQFHQIGVEAFDSENPTLDVKIMAMALDFFKQLGIQQIKLVINSLGDRKTRATYHQALIDYLEPRMVELSEDSQRRLHENPLRMLDSKDKKDKMIVAEAPSILNYLNEPSKAYFEAATGMSDLLEVPYEVDGNMVRGLDYYTRTTFEIMSKAPKMGAQSTICTEDRYSGLVGELSGPGTLGSGFDMGVERVLLTAEAEEVVIPMLSGLGAYVVGIGSDANVAALQLVQSIRNFGFSADRDYMNRKPKAQFKAADELQAKLVLIIGENKLNEDIVNVRSMATREEKAFLLSAIYDSFDEVYDGVMTKMIEG